ncbi:MAG: DJ-1/PfpI family protein, partial [Firmicutes bacterium]|nr:DJ-1/PfpI family protein [Bacillota bacterium]
ARHFQQEGFRLGTKLPPRSPLEQRGPLVVDGKFYTSAGVSAGIDMALGFVRDVYGLEQAQEIIKRMEYHWNSNAEQDCF